jgi:hypothetical protein
MSWVTFNVIVNGNQNADGQMQFACTLSNNDQTMNIGATLQYARDSSPTPPPNPITLFTTTEAITANANGTFTLPNVTLTTRFPVQSIPGTFTGGSKYNTISNLSYDPSTGVLSGTFTDVGTAGNDDPCNWDATVTGSAAGAKKAGY